MRRVHLRRVAALAAPALFAGALACFQDAQGPARPNPAFLALTPDFALIGEGAARLVPVARVRIVLLRPGTSTVHVDTTIDYPVGQDSLVFSLAVPILGITASESFDLNLALIGATGDTVFRAGPTPVSVTAPREGAPPPAPVPVPVRYVGTGSNAARLRLVVHDTAFRFGDTLMLATTVFDSAGAPLPLTPVVFESLDTNRVRVPRGTAFLIAKPLRGSLRVIAKTLTGQADTATLLVRPVPSRVELVSGNAQTGEVDQPLGAPMVVRVMAADGEPVPGATVKFFASAGSGAVPDSVTTADALGVARSPWKLGTVAGPMTARAEVSAPRTPVTGSPLAFAATATHGAPSKVVYSASVPATNVAGVAFAPAVVVTVKDRFDNIATTFADTVAVKLNNPLLAAGAVPVDSFLTGARRVKAVAGVATFTGLAVKKAATGFTLTTGVPSRGTIPLVSSAEFAVGAAEAARLLYVAAPAGPLVAGAVATPAPSVSVTDAFDNVVTTFTGMVTLALDANPASGVLAGGTTVAATAGVASFPDLRIEKAGAGYTVRASSGTLTSVVSPAFAVQPAEAAKLVFSTPPAGAAAGAPLGSIVVTVQDAFGNPVLAHTGDVNITLATSPTGATLDGTATAAVAGNSATFSTLAVKKAGSGYQLGAASGALTLATSTTFDIAPGPVANLTFTSAPATVAAGAPVTPGVQVQAADAFGNVVTSFTGSIVLDFAANPGGATLAGPVSVPAAGGVATFAGLSLDKPGTGYILRATSGSITTSSGAFAVTAGPAASLHFSAQPPATIGAGSPFPGSFTLVAKDAIGNLASDFAGVVTLSLGSNEEGATLSGTTSATAGGGTVSFSGLSIDRPGTYTIIASSGALTVATSDNIVVSATTAAAIIALEPILQFGSAGGLLAAPFRVRVLDASANPMPGITVLFAISTGEELGGEGGSGFVTDGELSALSAVTDAAGEAGVTLRLGSTPGINFVVAAVSGIPVPVFFAGFALGGEGARIWLGGASGDPSNWHNPNNWSPVGVPNDTDNVQIGLFASTSPTLTANAIAKNVTITGEGTLLALGVHNLEVKENFIAAAAAASFTTGSLILSGTGLVSGENLPRTIVTGTYTIFDESGFASDLTVSGATATLVLSPGSDVNVDGNFSVTSSGLLVQTGGSTDLVIQGNAMFDGRHMADTSLIAGTVRVAGTFHVPCSGSFRASGSHILILFSDGGPQTITMPCAGLGSLDDQINELQVDNVAGATSSGTLVIRAEADVSGGTLTAPIAYVRQVHDLTGGAHWLVPDTRIRGFGATAVSLPNAITSNVTMEDGNLALFGRPTITGNLTVTGGATRLDMNARGMTVTGNFTTASGARLRMVNALDTLIVQGNALFDGLRMGDSLLVAGVIRLRGNFTSTSIDNFSGAGTHKTLLDGTAAQSVSMNGAATSPTTGHFNHLEVNNAAGVSLLTDVATMMDMILTSGVVSGGGTSNVLIKGQLIDPGALLQTGQVTFTWIGTGTFAMPPLLKPNVYLFGGTFTLANGFAVAGGRTLRVTGSSNLDLNGKTVVAGGQFEVVSAGRLFMRNALDSLKVADSVIFAGARTADTTLTSGVITVGRDFRSSSIDNFSASGTHKVVFNGAAPQSVNMNGAGFSTTASHFRHLEINNAAGVTFTTNGHANGNVVVTSGLVTGATQTMTIAGTLTDGSANWRTRDLVFSRPGGGSFTTPLNFNTHVWFSGGTFSLANGFTTAAGKDVTIDQASNLDLAGQTVTVGGGFRIFSSGRLFMRNPSDLLVVTDSVYFSGARTADTTLTAGEIRVRGAFTSNSIDNFSASGTHKVTFNGSTSQLVNMNGPGAGTTASHFKRIDINNPAGVVFNSNGWANGDANVVTGLVTGALRTVSIAGVVTDPSGSWQTGNLELARPGTGSYVIPTTINTNLIFDGGTFTLANGFTVAAGKNVTIEGNSNVDLAGNTVTVGGTARITNSGRLFMRNAGDMLLVADSMVFDGARTADTTLTAGQITVGRNFRSSSIDNFSATGTHLVTFNGTVPQVIQMNGPGASTTSSHFRALHIDNLAGVSFNTAGYITGDVTILNGTVSGATTVSIRGSLVDALGGRFAPTTTEFTRPTGGSFALPATMNSNLLFDGGRFTMASGFTTSAGKNITLENASGFDVNGQTVNVGGEFRINGSALLIMRNVSDLLDVADSIIFAGLRTADTALTAGTIRVAKNFRSSNIDNFSASGTHTVIFDGTGTQQMVMNNAGSALTQGHFKNLRIANTAGNVTLTNGLHANGDVTLDPATSLNSPTGSLTVIGSVTSGAGATLAMNELRLGGTLSHPVGTFNPDTVEFIGVGQTIPTLPAPYNHLFVSGRASLGGTLTTNASLQLLSTGALNMSGQTANVGGQLRVENSSVLLMQNAADVMIVADSAVFQGLRTADTALVAGVLRVRKNFRNSNIDNFSSAGTHKVIFDGTTPQTVNMNNPGFPTTASHFNVVEFNNPAGVNFVSNGHVNVSATVLAGVVSGAGRTVNVRGTLVDAPGGNWTVAATEFSRPTSGPFTLPPVMNSDLTFNGGQFQLSSGFETSVGKSVIITGNSSLKMNGKTVKVGGQVNIQSSGVLLMQNALDSLDIADSVVFQGLRTQDTALVAGKLVVRKDFRSSNIDNFSGALAHRTIFAGTTPQFIRMNNAGSGLFTGHFRTLEVRNNTANVRLATSVFVMDTLRLTNGGAMDASVSSAHISVLGPLSGSVGTAVQMKGITLGGLMADSGFFNPDTVIFNGSGQTMPLNVGGGTPTWNTVIVQDSVQAGGALTMGRLIIDNGDDFGIGVSQAVFNNGVFTATISDSLWTRNAGVLRQTGGLIQVGTGARFEGGNTAGRLTGGTFSVAGPFTASAGTAVFQASSAHTTQLSGAGAQPVSIGSGGFGVTNNRFSHLQIVNSSGAGITLSTDVYADARLGTPAGTGTIRTITSAQKKIISHGLDADGLKWVNSAMVVEQMTAGFLRFDNSDWSATTVDAAGFDYARINHNGAGLFFFNGFVMPGSAGTSKWLVVDGLGGGSFQVSVNGTPGFAPIARKSELNGATICWGC